MEKDNMLLCLAVLIPLFVFCAFAFYFNVLKNFFDEVSYIKREMQRSGSEREYRYWRRMLKRCYASLFTSFFKKR